jgi:hypothetical protein
VKNEAFAVAIRAERAPPPQLRHGWHWLVLAAAFAPLIAACTPSTVGGVRGETAFAATARVETHDSKFAADAVAACFRKHATFLPKSRFEPLPGGGSRYILAGYGLWFEEISFTPAAGGSVVEVKSSGAYDAKWIAMMARDRLEPLGACLANPAWTGDTK